MNILSIQSSVAFGHVGNSAAVFPLQRLGHEVWPIDTVQFSNHTGYGNWTGEVFPAKHLAEILDGIERRGVLPACRAVLSGYLGDAAAGAVVLDAVARVRKAAGRALYCCDPVIGDDGRGIFVRPDIPDFFRHQALPAADIATPNQFELEYLTGQQIKDLTSAIEAARKLRQNGPDLVAVTSLRAPAVPEGRLGSLLVAGDAAWLIHTPLLDFPIPPNGGGDVFAALLLGRLVSGAPPAEALELTVNGLFALLTATMAEGSRELLLIAAQDPLTRPERRFTAEALAL